MLVLLVHFLPSLFLFSLVFWLSSSGSFYGAPFTELLSGLLLRGSFQGSFERYVPRVTFYFILNGFLITSQDDGLSTLDSFQANSIDFIDYSLNRERS